MSMTLYDIASFFEGAQQQGEKFLAYCPVCRSNSSHKHLYISERDDRQGAMVYCQKCQEAAPAATIMGAVGRTVADLYYDRSRGSRPTERPAPMPAAPKQGKQPRWMQQINNKAKDGDKLLPLIKTYEYRDKTGASIVAIKAKYQEGNRKTFRWFTPCQDQRGGYFSGDQSRPVLYNLPNLTYAVDGTPIFFVEGEKDADTMWNLGYIATTTPNGGNQTSWEPSFCDCLTDKDVVVITDNDKTGNDYGEFVASHVEAVAKSVRVIKSTDIYPQIGEKGDITDILETIGEAKTMEALTEAVKNAPVYQKTEPEQQEPPKPLVTCFSEVEYEEPHFLIAPYFPVGKISIVQGDSGVGKTAFMCGIAAMVSTGKPILDTPCEAGNVLILSVEDDAPVLRGRIEASGGNVRKCFMIEDAAERCLTFTSPEVEQAVKDTNAKLVIFDPLQMFMGAGVDMHRANETRPILSSLAAMAKRNDCAVVIISHMGKMHSKAIYGALGSVDIAAASRSVLQIGRDPGDPDECAAVQIKSSNAAKGKGVSYTIGDRGGVHWTHYNDLDPEDLERARARKETGVEYDQEPLVVVIRKLIAENPDGLFMAYTDFATCCSSELGFKPFEGNRDLGAKLHKLAKECVLHDHIRIDEGKTARPKAYYWNAEAQTPCTTGTAKGVEFRPYTLPNMAQTSIHQGT